MGFVSAHGSDRTAGIGGSQAISSLREKVGAEHLVRGRLQNGLSGELAVHSLPGLPVSSNQHQGSVNQDQPRYGEFHKFRNVPNVPAVVL